LIRAGAHREHLRRARRWDANQTTLEPKPLFA